MRYPTLFFDLDHTLWDFEQNSALTLACLYKEFELGVYGFGFADFHHQYEIINNKMWNRFRKGFISRKDLRWKRMMQTLLLFKVGNEKLAHQLSERYLDILPKQGKLIPGAREILDYCQRKGYKMHLITNGFETTQHEKLETSGISGYFDKMVTSENSNSMKPKPEIFEFALKAAGARVDDSIMIGDSLEADIYGARAVKMDQVYFNPGQVPHHETVTYEIRALAELEGIL